VPRGQKERGNRRRRVRNAVKQNQNQGQSHPAIVA
jgi:hypothetical protein